MPRATAGGSQPGVEPERRGAEAGRELDQLATWPPIDLVALEQQHAAPGCAERRRGDQAVRAARR